MRRLSLLQERQAWRIGEVGAAIVALASFLTGVFVQFQFDYSRPRVPSPLEGRVYPLNTHGSRVYLNAHEHFVLTLFFILFVVFAAIAVAIDRLKGPFRSS